MLKFIYKMMIISLLSGSLMLMDFSYKGIQIQSVQAETLKTEGAKDGDLMATITMTSIGLLTQRLYMCKMTTDMMIAAAGGALFIAGEILATLKLKKVMKDLETEITRTKDGKLDQKQVEALEKLKKSYEEAKNTANTKKMLQQAAAAAFAAAAVAAYMQVAQEKAAMVACKAAMTTAGTTCLNLSPMTTANAGVLASLFGTREIPKPSNAGMTAQTTLEASEKAAETATSTTATTLATSYSATCATVYGAWACPFATACAAAPAEVAAACAPITPILKVTSGVCPAALSVYNNFSTPSRYYANVYGPKLFIVGILSRMLGENARAEMFSPLGIMSSGVISILMATNASLGPTIDSYLLTPMNRAIIWGVLGGLTFAASSATDNQIAKMDSNIQKIDNILRAMNGLAGGSEAVNPNISKPTVKAVQAADMKINALNGANEDIDMSGLPGGKMPCFTGEKKECDSMEDKLEKDEGFIAMNAPSQSMIRNIMHTANGYNGRARISAATLNDTAKLVGSAQAINTALAKAKMKFNDENKDKKSVEQREKDLASSIEKSVKAQLKKSGMTSNQLASAMYGGSISGSSSGSAAVSDAAKDSKKDAKLNAVGAIDIGAPAAVVAPSDLGIAKDEAPQELSDEEKNAALATASANAPTIDDYDLKNDISKDKDTSIFELISNRYQKSGYQRLFKRVK